MACLTPLDDELRSADEFPCVDETLLLTGVRLFLPALLAIELRLSDWFALALLVLSLDEELIAPMFSPRIPPPVPLGPYESSLSM